MTHSAAHVGRFRFSPDSDRWWWSDGMFGVHGMDPGAVVPTRPLFLSHVHADDRPRVEAALAAALTSPEPQACDYRLLDLQGAARAAVLAAAGDATSTGERSVSGFVVDLSDSLSRSIAAAVNVHLDRALQAHAAIDQAKGVVMGAYGVDSDAAFGLLRSASQDQNVRLRTLADRVLQAVIATERSSVPRAAIDLVLGSQIDGVAHDGARHAVPAAPAPPELGAGDLDHLDARGA